MSVYKRPGSPYYYASFQIDGRKFLRSTRCTTEREARVEERRIRQEERERIKHRTTDRLSLDQGFARYWREHGHRLAWRTEVDRYIKEILARTNADLPIEDLTDAEVNDFVQIWVEQERGAYALNRSLSIWRAMHRRAAKKWRQRTHNIDWAEHMNPEKKRVRWLTVDEALRLIQALPPHVALAAEWSLYTGCRQFETYDLIWPDVRIDRSQITITAKGGERQTRWLNEQAIELLSRIEPKGRYVFDRRGRRRAFETACKRIGLEDFRWHDLRHTHATWLRQSGVPVEVVQRSLGHADVATTMRYAHVADGELQEALHKLPSLAGHTPKIVTLKSRKVL